MAGENAIIVRRVKKSSHGGHHGGAWKVAYADFVTAMMAFFLLMWLINTTTPEQKRGIADYFAPQSVSRATSGAGGILGGTVFGEQGSKAGGSVAVVMKLNPPQPQGSADDPALTPANGGSTQATGEDSSSQALNDSALDAALASREEREFAEAEESLRQAMQDMPDLAALSKQIIVDQTPEGMRIQLVDQEGRPMYAAGGAAPLDHTRRVLEEVAKIVMRLPNRISISGHTDGAAFQRADGYSNWELSADRANAARRILMDAGVPAGRIALVAGRAGADPLYPDDPSASANRRISIVLLREAPPLPPGHTP